MKRLLIYLKDYRRECVLGPLFKLFEALFELFVPLVVASIIDEGIAKGDTGHIWGMSLLMVLLGFVGLAFSITAQYFAAKAAVGFSGKLRSRLFAHMQRLSAEEADSLGQSTMITRLTSDINQLQNGVNLALRLFLRSPFIVIGAAVMAFFVDARSAVIFLFTIPVLSVIVFAIMLGGAPLYKKVQGKLDRVLELTRENLTGVRVIRAFRAEEKEEKLFESENNALMKRQVFAGKISALMNPLTVVVVNLSIAYILYAGAVRVDAGLLSQGEVVALINYMSQILTELVKLASLIITVSKAVACGNRVADVLDMKVGMEKSEGERGGDYEIEFDNVELRYKGAGAPSLTNISFKVKRGQSVGIIGVTGSGKSSLVNLIPRFYDVTGGRVLVEGKDVRSYDTGELRKKIGVVPQKAQLFKGTIRSNVAFGNKDASESVIFDAIKCAQAEDVVNVKGGLDAKIAQGGKNLSGGQRQRLTIARALAAQPDILILDDSGSALDYQTDYNLRRAIAERRDMTTVIVSQRASSVALCDFIVVLEDGEIAGMGTHEELLESSPVYEEIYYSQFERSEKA
ncbi:MAG: ABC transporter ATP-binding protein/permease [Clostridia bacterium]|nr:ABC transporter ATP-binding protein/permease [Clostridia bacterium]